MQKFFSALFGFFVTVLGTLIVLPRVNDTLWKLQLVLNEFPYVVSLMGVSAALKPRRNSLAAAFGLWGAALAFVPLTRIRHAINDMDKAMQDGYGDYERQIPAAMKERIAKSRLSLKNTAGATYLKQRVAEQQDIPFLDTPTRQLLLDVYRPLVPPGDGGSTYPAIIVIHGGSWTEGDKGSYFAWHNRYLAGQGYVVFDIQYRFTRRDSAQWPTQLEDVREAIRWIKAHAATWNFDPERIALIGRSAGGHLALQAAYRAVDGAEDTAVKAVIGIYAPINLRLTGARHNENVVALLAGTSYEVPEAYGDASPLDFARDDLPPTLLLHGYMDKLVGPVHSELLLNRLRSTNTPVALLRVPWGRHGFDALMNGLGAQITQYYMDRFLAWSLYAQK
jgi:acetyl esterase/lipase